MSYNDEVPFPEPFGPLYVRPAGAPCPGCECCTQQLCEVAASKSLPCSSVADDRQAVSGCRCTQLVLCAHADQDGQGAHLLAPGEKCHLLTPEETA